MVRHGDGTLRLPAQSFELGGVLVERANSFLAAHSGAEAVLRRVLTLRCATVREDGEPTRRRAPREELSDEEWRLVSELADYPNRLLVTVTTEAGETYAEVAHEAIFRRWDKLREWIDGEREFLIWRTGLERDRSRWQAASDATKQDALLMGIALNQAQDWLARRAEDLPAGDRELIALSVEQAKRAQGRARHVRAAINGLAAAVIIGLIGWINQSAIADQWRWWWIERPFLAANLWSYVLNPPAEQALKSGESFRECAPRQNGKDFCPDMVVVPAGSFTMGSPPIDKLALDDEVPAHPVTIAKPFAVSEFELTFAEWDTCVAHGGCAVVPDDAGWGRGEQPVIYVSWDDARQYVEWLSKTTGKPYRLLTEAEYEYATRAGTTTRFPWDADIDGGRNQANCFNCGGQWHGKQAAPVGSTPNGFIGSFAPNAFGLHDMVGNVWEWGGGLL